MRDKNEQVKKKKKDGQWVTEYKETASSALSNTSSLGGGDKGSILRQNSSLFYSLNILCTVRVHSTAPEGEGMEGPDGDGGRNKNK